MPSYSDVLSSFALVVSLGSLSVSAYVAFRDRPRLKVASQFFRASEYGPDRIVLTLINRGRRPIILRLLGGTTKVGKWSAMFLGEDKGGLRLGDYERHEHTIEKEDTVNFDLEGDNILFESLWVEDSLGNRYHVPNSEEHVGELWSELK